MPTRAKAYGKKIIEEGEGREEGQRGVIQRGKTVAIYMLKVTGHDYA
jgi:hypothetical protein